MEQAAKRVVTRIDREHGIGRARSDREQEVIETGQTSRPVILGVHPDEEGFPDISGNGSVEVVEGFGLVDR